MKPRVYLIVLLLIIPFQARLLSPLSIAGITPDLCLIVAYVIGLLTSPREAAFAGIAVGLLQDINAASYLGLMGFTQGLVGLFAGFLGKRVLNVSSMSNIAFLAAFSLMESIFLAVFIEIMYGSVPFFSMVFGNMLPRAFYTGLFGVVLLQLITTKGVITMLTRRSLQREA
jgi:rod shape-determining protein MreD